MQPELAKLVTDLEQAHRTFTRPAAPDLQEDDNPRQAGAIESLSAVMNYLRAAGVRLELYAPIAALLAGLGDASEGRSSTILAKARYHKGTSKKPIFETLDLAAAAAAVTILYEDAGEDLDKAARAAAVSVGITKNSLLEFRKNIVKRRASAKAIENYTFFLDTARSYTQFSPTEQAHRALGVARAWKGAKGS